MNIRDQLLYEHSKANTLQIVGYIGNDLVKFDHLFSLLIKNEEIISQRAAHSVDHCLRRDPSLILPYLDRLVANLTVPNQHNSIVRTSLRAMGTIPIPEHLQGELLDLCFQFILNEKYAIAIRAFSITVAYNIAKSYPELLTELKYIIENFPDHESAALRSRSKKTLLLIKKHRI